MTCRGDTTHWNAIISTEQPTNQPTKSCPAPPVVVVDIMEATNLPKVSKILSSKPVSEATAFQAVARFLEKEQKRLDPVALQKASHLNDAFLVCEALAAGAGEKDQLERLRNSSTIRVEKETKLFHPGRVESSSSPCEPLAGAAGGGKKPSAVMPRNGTTVLDDGPVAHQDGPVASAPHDSPVAANVLSMVPGAPDSESAAVKQEFIVAPDQQPSAPRMDVKSHDDDRRAKRKADNKAKTKKKKQKGHNNE
jgi:hypothetical protein